MMGVIQGFKDRADSWANTLTGLGNALRDKREWTYFLSRSRMSDQLLENLYHQEDIAARIVDALPSEALRNGYYLSSEDDDPDLASALIEYDRAHRLKFARKLKEAAIWARLFGGAVIYLGIDDGQSEDMPVNEKAVQSIRWAQVLDRRYILPVTYYRDTDRYGEPEIYQIQRTAKPTVTDGAVLQSGAKIHESRLLRLDGALTSQTRQDQNNGWSDSVLEKVHEVIRDFGSSWQAVNHLLQDAGQGVFKIRGLIETMAEGGKNALIERMQLIDMSRSVARAIALDAELEEFERAHYTFQGLPDIMRLQMVRLAAAANMPVIVLMRQSPSGLNATGDSDIRLWYDQVKEYQTDTLQDLITRYYELVCAASDFTGTRPDSWSVRFDRLWQMTDQEQAALEKAVAEKDKVYIDAGVVLPEEVALCRFKARGFSMDTQIDTGAREEMCEAELELAREKAGEAPEPPPIQAPAADPAAAPAAASDQVPDNRADAARFDFIEHRGRKWVVLSKSGQVLGEHDTEAEARRQLRAVEARKHSR